MVAWWESLDLVMRVLYYNSCDTGNGNSDGSVSVRGI